MADKDLEVGSEILPFAATASAELSDIDGINEMNLKDVVDEKGNIMLIVRHYVILREGLKNAQKKST